MKANKNGVKLLAAVAVFVMMFAGAAVILGSENTDATTTLPDGFSSTPTESKEYTVTGTITDAIVLNESSSPVTITLNYALTTANTPMVNNTTITVGNNVKLVMNMTAASAMHCNMIVNTAITLSGNAELVLMEDSNISGQVWWNSTAKDLTMSGTSKLTLQNAGGFSGVNGKLSVTAQVVVESTNSAAAALNFTTYSDETGNKIIVNDGKVFPYFAAVSTIKGEIDAPESKVVFAAGANKVDGKVDASTVEVRGTATIETGKADAQINADFSADTIAGAVGLFTKQNEVTVSSNQTLTADVVIPAGKTLILDGCTVVDTESKNYIIVVNGDLQSNGAYIFVGVSMTENATFSSSNTHKNSISGTMVDDYKVGFGDELTISGTIPANVTVDAYGTLVMNDVNIAGTVNTYVGSTVDVQGTVTVSSAFTVQAGAEMELNGTITVRNDANGGAIFTLASKTDAVAGARPALVSKLTVASDGTFNINKPTANSALGNPNKLVVGTDAEFIVEGTLNVTGGVTGTIIDKGTVNFNGTAIGTTTIVLFDGMDITIQSVTGTLTVTDAGAAKDVVPSSATYADVVSEGNTVELQNVKGVTVTSDITTKNNKANSERFYLSNMTVSGTVSKITGVTGDASIQINRNSDYVTIDSKQVYGTMTVADTLVVGANVAATIGGTVKIAGTMSVSDETNAGTITVPNGAVMDVAGTVTAKQGQITVNGTVNAVYYVISTTTDRNTKVVDYYTGFAAAVNAIGDADDDTIIVKGTVTESADASVATGMTITVERNATLTIGSDAILTIEDGANLAVTGTVTVKGTLVIVNSDTGLSTGTLKYDTSKANGKTVTYTSLAKALGDASEGDVITLSQNVDLEGTVTIPAGVTVQTGKNKVTLKDNAVLNVDGTFAIQNGGSIDKAADDNAWGDDVKVNVNGTLTSTSAFTYDTYKIAGAYYAVKNVNYVSSLAVAAGLMNDGTVTIDGAVSAGDVTFTEKENGTLGITVASEATLSVSELTLEGATLTSTGTTNGKITAASGDSTATVTLGKSTGLTVESTKKTVGTEQVDTLVISSAGATGTITVSEGTVDVGNGSNGLSVTRADNVFTVASGATANLLKVITFGAAGATEASAIIDGTANIIGTTTVNGIMDVTGEVVIEKISNSDAAKLVVNGLMNVTGKVTVSEKENLAGTFEIGTSTTTSGIVAVGSKVTSLGATGEIVGKVALLNNSYVRAYTGATVSDAKFDWNPSTEESDAVSTVLYINGVEYMTVYANDDNDKALFGKTGSILADVWQTGVGLGIAGIDTVGDNDARLIDKWFSDEAILVPVTTAQNKIGGLDAAYLDAPISTASIIASIGSGMSLWIDGVKYASGEGVDLTVGTHDVSVTVNPGYAGTPAITFNGQTVSNGKITVTTDMVGERNILSVNGEITIAGGNSGSSSSDDGMGITDYLLIVLVVLAAILVVIVALRMMRS